MSDKRLNNQLTLAFPTEDRGEALRAVEGSVESLAADRPVESPGMGDQLREVCTGGQSLNPPNRRIRTRTYGGVTGKAGDRLPMSIFCPVVALLVPCDARRLRRLRNSLRGERYLSAQTVLAESPESAALLGHAR